MKRVRLRWYFEYFDRPDYFGVWSMDDPARPAWSHCYEGIARAMIQGKDLEGKISVLAEVPGQDFQNFQWIAIAKASAQHIKRGWKLPAQIVGLQIQHRAGQIQCYIDGSIARNDITYPTIHFAAYGR
jgi:hypothetical protein